MDSKTNNRVLVKEKRKKITNNELKQKIITKKLLENRHILNSKNILVYISMNDEVSTRYLIEELFELKKNIYAPKLLGKEIKFYKIKSFEDLKKGKFNILEPSGYIELDSNEAVIIVPGLLFDKEGNRLGYGGGYYDRFLKNKDFYKIGICFSDFLVDKIEIEEHDIKMNLVITEKENGI